MKKLDESGFVRHRMYDSGQTPWRRYASFVIGEPSFLRLLDYELRIAFFGSTPGALGLVLRRRFFRRLFRRMGRNVVIGRNVTIRHGDKITVGDNVVLDDGCVLDGRGAGEEGVLIGDNTIVGRNVTIQSKVGPIRIGPNCNIGSYTAITSQGGIEIGEWVQLAGSCKISGGRFKLEPGMKKGVPFTRYSNGPIRIGECCFLGGNVQITDGAVIGRCSVVGAGAIVMSSIPEHSVYMPRPGMIMGSTRPGPRESSADPNES
jgi:acetyltransferase-like isoleucine patch superfamily enzyme